MHQTNTIAQKEDGGTVHPHPCNWRWHGICPINSLCLNQVDLLKGSLTKVLHGIITHSWSNARKVRCLLYIYFTDRQDEGVKRRLALCAYRVSHAGNLAPVRQKHSRCHHHLLVCVCVSMCLCAWMHKCVSLSVLLCFRAYECELVCRGERVRQYVWDRKRRMFLFLQSISRFFVCSWENS